LQVAVLNQLFSREALFKRAISMSGTPLMLKPIPVTITEMVYSNIIKALDLENASVEDRIKHLVNDYATRTVPGRRHRTDVDKLQRPNE
jgi:hypothetical protein